VGAGILLGAGVAHADDSDGARRDFTEGVRLLQLGDFEGARRLFKRADAAHHAPSVVYNLGLVEERLGHAQAAVDAYEAYVAEAGDTGELSAAAAVALAQVRARSTRMRIGTSPLGARIFVDGNALPEAAPTAWLVTAGHHVIVAQGTGWRAEQDVVARGAGDLVEVLLTRPEEAAPTPAAATTPASISDADRDTQPATNAPNDLVLGAAFALVPFRLLGAQNADHGNGEGATQAMVGGIVEAGYAITERFELLFRGLVAFGRDARPSHVTMGGPGVSLRIGSRAWLGASFVGGQLSTEAHFRDFHTDFAFGALAEATYAVVTTQHGEWSVGFQPGCLITDGAYTNTAFLFPLSLGYRFY
jgi:hypothetical protein